MVKRDTPRTIQWIRHYDAGAGFFALVTYALNGIRWAEKHGRIPVVKFDGASTPAFYDPTRGENVWEYFFEPVSPWSSAEADQAERGGVPAVTLTKKELGHLHHHDPDRVATFWSYDRPSDAAAWMRNKRELGRWYVATYIRVQPKIQEIVDAFWGQQLAGRPVLGVHIRGTDLEYADPLAPECYFACIDQRLAQPEWADARLFIATDQVQFLELFLKKYQDRLVYRDCLRSATATAPFQMSTERSGYMMGEEVLVDALLLSRCGHIIKGPAALGEYALWFNAGVDCDDLALESDFDPRSRSGSRSAYDRLNVDGRAGWLHALAMLPDRVTLACSRLRWRISRRLREGGENRNNTDRPR